MTDRQGERADARGQDPLWSWNTADGGVEVNIWSPVAATVFIGVRDLRRMVNHSELMDRTRRASGATQAGDV